LRILFVIANLANGGAERVLSVISNEFAKQNDVHIAVLERDFGLYKFLPNITFYHLGLKSGGLMASINKILTLRSLFKRNNPDVIVSFIDWTNVICVLSNLGLGFKHIATEHHANEYLKSAKFRIIRNLAYRKVDGLTVLSRSDFDYYKFVKNCIILHNPFFLEQNYKLDIKKENLILSVARLEAVKGYDIYFRALSLLDKKLLEKWRIVIAGSGSMESELKDLAKKFELNIEFLGHITNVAPLYLRARIFVLSSRSEGLSNVLIESAFFACARISSDTVGGKELIENGENGLLFKNGDEADLARILTKLLCNESMIEELGTKAMMQTDMFSIENIFKKWQQFVGDIVGKNGK